MAKGKKQANTGSPFFKFEQDGDTITGKFAEFIKTNLGIALKLTTKEGDRLVGLSVVLAGFVNDNFTRFTKGSTVTITRTGRKKRTILYSVEIGGKELVRTSGNFATASRDEVTEFLEAMSRGDYAAAKGKGGKKSKR